MQDFNHKKIITREHNMRQDITQEAIAIIQSAGLLSGGDSSLFNYNLDFLIDNSIYSRQEIKKEVDRLQSFKIDF